MEADLPPELPTAEKTLTAKCKCGSIHFTVTLPSSSLPLPVHLCHCSVCRYTHGTLCIFHAPLPARIEPTFINPSSLSNATAYLHQDSAQSERFFCSTCGAHFGDRDVEPDADGIKEWRVATSLFEGQGEQERWFQIRSHTFTVGTHGGLHDWLPRMGERAMHVWNPKVDGEGEVEVEKGRPEQEFGTDGDERLRVECHCGGVSFAIPRPTDGKCKGVEGLESYVSPVEEGKWTAVLDLCDDCRLVDGTHVQGWVYVPLEVLEPKVGADLKLGTVKTYQSNGGVLRGFCGTCGATVFFEEESRKYNGFVDVAVGLLRAPEGVLAERWLTWRTGRISYYESGEKYDATFARSLKEGVEEWGRQKYGKNPDWNID